MILIVSVILVCYDYLSFSFIFIAVESSSQLVFCPCTTSTGFLFLYKCYDSLIFSHSKITSGNQLLFLILTTYADDPLPFSLACLSWTLITNAHSTIRCDSFHTFRTCFPLSFDILSSSMNSNWFRFLHQLFIIHQCPSIVHQLFSISNLNKDSFQCSFNHNHNGHFITRMYLLHPESRDQL